MIHAMRRSVGERLEQVYYALLRTTVTRFVPAAIPFDEQDPILEAGLRPDHRVR